MVLAVEFSCKILTLFIIGESYGTHFIDYQT